MLGLKPSLLERIGSEDNQIPKYYFPVGEESVLHKMSQLRSSVNYVTNQNNVPVQTNFSNKRGTNKCDKAHCKPQNPLFNLNWGNRLQVMSLTQLDFASARCFLA